MNAALADAPDPVVSATLDLLHRRYGIRAGSVRQLGGEVDLNLAVVGDDEQRVVVKVGPADADLGRLRWQHDLLRSFPRDPDLPLVPQVLATRDGAEIVPLDVDGASRPVRVQTWLPGRIISDLTRHSADLLAQWGRAAAFLTAALADCRPPAGVAQTHHWDALRAPEAITAGLTADISGPERMAVELLVQRFDDCVPARLDNLPRQVVHQDLNDFNVLAVPDDVGRHRITGVLDFGDVLHTARVSELAVAVAYAMLRKPDPLVAAAEVVRGYAQITAPSDDELAVIFPIAAARLCVNAVTWTARSGTNGSYARARMQYTWPTVRLLAELPPELAYATLRDAVGRAEKTPVIVAPAPTGHLEPVSRAFTPVPDRPRRRTDSGVPATTRLATELRTGPSVAVPIDGIVVAGASDHLVLHHQTEPECWSRWRGVSTHAPPGSILCRGTQLSTPAGTVSVALFTTADIALAAPDAVPWTMLPAWRQVCLDPGQLWGTAYAAPSAPDVVGQRRRHFASSQRHYFDRPPRLVASRDVWLYDDHGLAYLDAINNVSHVGHANPAVVEAMHRQAGLLNTNSRFVYDGIAQYAGRLADLLPDPLEVVFLVCSGSEANDLALRIARQVTGREDVVVIDGAYHGNTAAVTAISPNRYRGPGGSGRPPTTHEAPQPNRYRGPYGYTDPAAGTRYAEAVSELVERLAREGRPPAAFVAESVLGTAGTIIPPPGYLATAFDSVRGAGGICISDEVQVGFGRLGSDFWGFATHGVVPDIVTMGKPIGNGHPLAAVVTTRAIADAFDTGMKYFNTFGGNPVSCAVGMAVLDEIEGRGLQANAADVGDYFLHALEALATRHQIIGDVRGLGLYLGVELVSDRQTREPATGAARYISERMKDEGVFTYPTGACDNILKLKPPMTFTREHADLFVAVLDDVLSSDW